MRWPWICCRGNGREEPRESDCDDIQHSRESAQTENHPTLGVIRLDYDYPPQVGDIDHPGSFAFPVEYRAVPGLTFEMCQLGKMTSQIERNFIEAIEFLESEGVVAITGDCGFMLHFQDLASRHTSKPVFMSSCCMLPAVRASICHQGKILVVTANSREFQAMHDLILEMCSTDTNRDKYVIVGVQDVPGFEPIFTRGMIDIPKAEAGIVEKCVKACSEHKISAILFECTQLPPFSDSVRAATKKPIFDAIVACDFFVDAFSDNPRFGLRTWYKTWDGRHSSFHIGKNLSESQRMQLVSPDGFEDTSKKGSIGKANSAEKE
mmetsp:Transcript_120575/g.313070  ORF Transcript_120575/g.313070 Transcript_120575/m.313070 type:complete len:321 (-) Transcript_120575:115-1077(-)